MRLNPAGDRVAYEVWWPNAEERRNDGRIFVRGLREDDEARQVSDGPGRDRAPEWAPDSQRLAYVSRRGPRDQLVVRDIVGGAEQQLTTIPDGVMMPRWSPDGKAIAFLGTVKSDPDGSVDDPRPPVNPGSLRREPVARVVNKLIYRQDGMVYFDGRRKHLFVVPATGGEPRQLTDGNWSVTLFSWAPDGKHLVVACNPDPDADLRRELNLYTVDLAGGMQKVVENKWVVDLAWSPRGDQIAFVACRGQAQQAYHDRLWVAPAEGGEVRCLTADFDLNVGDSVLSDMRSVAAHGSPRDRMVWDREGGRIYFNASGSGGVGIYSSDLHGRTRQEVGGQRKIYDFDVAPTGLAFLASDLHGPGDLFWADATGERRLTDLNPWLAECYVAVPERQKFIAPDGLAIDGWLLMPPGFDPSRKYPLIMQAHGGPNLQYGWCFYHEMQILAGHGYLVLYVNPRGSDGYGERFRRAAIFDWGGKDFKDLMVALDQVVAKGYVDTTRMGFAGGSYGGFMTNWVVGHTDRFAAAVSMRSVVNMVSFYTIPDVVFLITSQVAAPPPWDNFEQLWERSPLRYVQNIKTPLLLIQNGADSGCTVAQAEEMFGALRLLRKPVELVIFPEEPHDLSRSGRPDRRVERLRRIVGWFGRYLKVTDKTAAAAV